MRKIRKDLKPKDLAEKLDRFWKLSGRKIKSIEKGWNPKKGSPVFTVRGRYTAKGWTEWTQGFQYGAALLQFDAVGDRTFLKLGREGTRRVMASHVTHMGVHDHGFNNVSTYGNLRRLMLEGRIPRDRNELDFYEMALKASGAVQARRWTKIANGEGYIYSFNGPHSLFVDTMRTLRALAVSHQLGHCLMEEKDLCVPLIERLIQHARTTATYVVYYGAGRDSYDVRGRAVHEAIFNTNDGNFRCPSSQQGYSPFTTWTRGLAWAMLGYAEELEWLKTRSSRELDLYGGRAKIERMMLKAAKAMCDFYITHTPADGMPYWDYGAPGLVHMGDYTDRPADPYNDYEPVDSSSAAIACQGLMRLGKYLGKKGATYFQAGLTVLDTMLDKPYLSTKSDHQGLILHSVYHRPNGWDYVPRGRKIPCGESSMWGDYHAREAALYVTRMIKGGPYYTFFAPV